MEKQTIVCTALPNGRAADGALLLSVHIAPRLWSSDTSVGKLALSQFPDLLAWPATLAGASWSVTFDGQPPAAATVVGAASRADLWGALFKTDTDVVPFRFEDHCDTAIESIDSVAIHDVLSAVYSRAATDPAYGSGKNLPSAEVLAADPDLSDIARATIPVELPERGPPPAPLDLGGKLPEPDHEPQRPPEQPRPPADWCRCICWLLRWLARPFPAFAAWVDRVCAAAPADDPPPAEETGPTSWAIPTKGIPPGAPLTVMPPPAPEPPLSYTPSGPPSAKKLVFDEVTVFVTAPPPAANKLPTAAELEEIYDFHSMIASLGDYPKLMRMLGVVVDLRIEAAAVDAPAAATVKAEPGIAFAMTTTVASPRTHYLLDDARFLAAPRADDPEISNGWLRLNDEAQFRVIQVDVVGSALKLQNAATNTMILSHKTRRAPNSPDNSGLPALRTGGISVVRRDFRSSLRKQFLRSAALQRMLAAKDSSPAPAPVTVPPPDPTDELFAEDLVRGYRIDVFDIKWRSLCQRKGTYDFLAAPAAPGGAISLEVEDEGFVQFSATTARGSDTSKSLRTTDSLFVWDGWSLCASRPGKTIMADDLPNGTTNLDTPKNEAKTRFKFEAYFKAKPGSLPRLRYGQTYRLRARICDLAGNSVVEPDSPALFAADVPEQTPPFTCVRYEPVSPPAMLQRAAPVEGESLERMVVRTPAIGGTDQATERHIIPPKVSQLVAEQHRKFDGAPTDPAKMDGTNIGYDRAARESGALTDGATKLAVAAPNQPANASELIWIFPGENYQLTYLPDPASRGALLLGLPGLNPDEIVEPPPASPTPVNKIPFGGSWPELEPFRLRLAPIADGTAPVRPQWDSANRVLTVELAEAGKKVVRISSFFGTDDFAQRGVSDWVKKEAPAEASRFEADAVAGRSWLHLPWREITLVHAVQRPLQPTSIAKLVAEKKLGATTATLQGELAPHVASTGKVDIRAEWEDPVDDPAQPGQGTRALRSHLCEVLVPEGAALPVAVEAGSDKKLPVHQFHDTKFHRVTYRAVATTRFREYFPATLTEHAANVTLENPTGMPVRILNSARPDAPRVLYIVPTYGWKKDAPGTGASHHRKGNGLRVYLDRPWYSSGDDERLGVVFIPDAKFISLSKVEKRLVTQWAADPTWLSEPTTEAARMENFPGIVDKGDGLILAETGQAVSAAGYKVEFDATRRLWFADIGLDIGLSYTPFVRLALARVQPNSVDGAHLSSIVRTDFVQLAADRSASYKVNATAGGAKVDILVKGPTYTASAVTLASDRMPDLFGKESGRAGRAEIEARLQRRNPAFGAQAELGWDTLTTELLTQNPADPGVWQGTVTSTTPLTPGQFRILLLEYEWYRSDFAAPESREVSVARRIVYADALDLG